MKKSRKLNNTQRKGQSGGLLVLTWVIQHTVPCKITKQHEQQLES